MIGVRGSLRGEKEPGKIMNRIAANLVGAKEHREITVISNYDGGKSSLAVLRGGCY